MDSLVANYASSDEEEERQQIQIPKIPSWSGFSNLPIPKLPSSSSSSSPGFSSLPIPKSQNPRRVVQFTPPIKPLGEDPDDDDLPDPNPKKRSRDGPTTSFSSASVKSLLSSLPAPKNSLSLGSGAAAPPPSIGSGRRAALQTQPLTDDREYTNYANDNSNSDSHPPSEPEHSDFVSSDANCAYYEGYGGGGDYVAVTPAAAVSVSAETPSWNVEMGIGRRGKREIPKGIVEVNQDELMKNRPRPDQSKVTGIAFGPSYQAAPTKGKPSKLHKRKHQIGSLYFDMKQKEMELAERRSRGMLTKSETQAKYGW